MSRYSIETSDKPRTVVRTVNDGWGHHEPCDSATAAIYEYARRRGLTVSGLCYDADTRGGVFAEASLTRYGAHVCHAVATRI